MIIYTSSNSMWDKVEYDKVLDLKTQYYNKVINKEALVEEIQQNIEAISCEDIEDDIVNTIISSKGTNYIYIENLEKYYKDIIKAMISQGYSLNRKDTKGIQYLVTSHLGETTVFYIKIYKNKKTIINIYDSNNIIRVKEEDLLQDFGSNINNRAYALGNALYQLNQLLLECTKTTKSYKLPYTITGYTKRIFRAYSKPFLPTLDIDIPDIGSMEKYIRNSYHGGFCYYKYDEPGQLGNGYILDVNSLYSAVMKYRSMPYGDHHYFKGKPSDGILERAYKDEVCIFFRIRTPLELKPDGVACIQKNKYVFEDITGECALNDTKAIERDKYIIKADKIELTLTYYDYLLLLDNYKTDIEYVDYLIFNGSKEIFSGYIDYFYTKKQHLYGGKKRIVKLLLNTLYGIMCRNNQYTNLEITDDATFCSYITNENKNSTIQIGAYIAAAARYKVISDAKKLYSKWVYTDTDSIHIISDTLPSTLNINESKMGAYKVEYEFETAIYFKKKTYILVDKNRRFKIVKAGCPIKSTQNLEKIMTALYNGYDSLLGKFRESYEKYEGYNKEEMIEFTKQLEHIVKTEDYVSISDLLIPVHKKVLKNKYNLVEKIEWQKFSYSPLDNI